MLSLPHTNTKPMNQQTTEHGNSKMNLKQETLKPEPSTLKHEAIILGPSIHTSTNSAETVLTTAIRTP